MVLVLGRSQLVDGALGIRPHPLCLDQRALPVVALVADVHDGVILELHREVVPHPAQHELTLADAVWFGLSDGAHPPGAVTRPPTTPGVTSISVPPTVSAPDQRPVWASRWVSKTTLPLLRMYWRGSATAGMWPSQMTSMATLCSVGWTTTRRRRKGSSTSIRKGPTERSPRSPSGADRARCAVSLRGARR